jgi:hypothetical protein
MLPPEFGTTSCPLLSAECIFDGPILNHDSKIVNICDKNNLMGNGAERGDYRSSGRAWRVSEQWKSIESIGAVEEHGEYRNSGRAWRVPEQWKSMGSTGAVESMESMKSIESMERIESIESMERIESMESIEQWSNASIAALRICGEKVSPYRRL